MSEGMMEMMKGVMAVLVVAAAVALTIWVLAVVEGIPEAVEQEEVLQQMLQVVVVALIMVVLTRRTLQDLIVVTPVMEK